jgi:hypothetical protein
MLHGCGSLQMDKKSLVASIVNIDFNLSFDRSHRYQNLSFEYRKFGKENCC